MNILFSRFLIERGSHELFVNALAETTANIVLPETEEAFVQELKCADVLVMTGRDHLDFSGTDNLRWIHVHGAGYNHIPVEELSERGIQVTPTIGGNADAMAEHAMLSLLSLAKQMPLMMRNQQARKWEVPAGQVMPVEGMPISHQTRELKGATLGIVGYGNAGRASAARAKAFGMRVVVFRRSATQPDNEAVDAIYALDDFGKHVGECDYVLLVTAASEANHHLVRKETLDCFKHDSCLINISRPSLVKTEDVVAALDSGQLGAAALDVFETEPLPASDPLWEHPRLMVTPHCAGYTPHFSQRSAEQFAANMQHYLADRPLTGAIQATVASKV